jgi:prolyl 4-hydroxylase
MTDTIISRADALLATGRTRDAVMLVAASAERGEPAALFQLALWHLIGAPLPRDVPRARALLTRARSIGHEDAALMEIALTANGSGAPADWAGALGLLRALAPSSAMAAAQLALLEAMALGSDGAPLALPNAESLSAACRIIRYPALFTPDECRHIASVAAGLLEPALIVDPRSGRQVPNPIRTSDAAVIGPTREDLVVRALNRRIARASGTAVEQGEALSVLRYAPGQQYRPHLDTLDNVRNQRTVTVLVYLNHGYAGGETHFPLLDLTIAPGGGDVIVFTNTAPDGRPDPLSRHAGLPVTQGTKWLATRWIRRAPVDPWNAATFN